MLKITRKLFVDNKEDMEKQVEQCMEIKDMGTKITKIAFCKDYNMGLLRYSACGICGIKYVFIAKDKIIVRNISSYLLSVEEMAHWENLIAVIKHNKKVDGVVQYRFK